MAWTSADMEAVETAIRTRLANGAVEDVAVAGQSLRYTSLEKLYELRDRIKRELNATTNGRARTYARFSRRS